MEGATDQRLCPTTRYLCPYGVIAEVNYDGEAFEHECLVNWFNVLCRDHLLRAKQGLDAHAVMPSPARVPPGEISPSMSHDWHFKIKRGL